MVVNYIFCVLLIGYWLFFDKSDIRVLYIALGFSLLGTIVETIIKRNVSINKQSEVKTEEERKEI